MYCDYFKIADDMGVCHASGNAHIPSIDEMGILCFRDTYYTCPIYRKYLEQADLHVIIIGFRGLLQCY